MGTDRTGAGPAQKYPRTPYWPWSASIAAGDRTHPAPEALVERTLVITEKLDGGNTALLEGEVYARSVDAPSSAPWMAMVRKHHAWKMTDPGWTLYGEDLFAVHSIAYAPVAEHETFRAFALRAPDGTFASWEDTVTWCGTIDIETVPVLFEGKFFSPRALNRWITWAMTEPSVLGGTREGVVVRWADAMTPDEFAIGCCKAVRANHVQTDEHWTRRWRRCALTTD